MEKLWTTAEVAKCLGIHDVDVEELVRQGKLTGYKLGGQFLRFRPDQVQALKGAITFRPNRRVRGAGRPLSTVGHITEFFYFYDFYVVSVICLAVLVVYLIAAG